jgi:methylphosphotriester-DNA--protein-cysteine methyltransferase
MSANKSVYGNKKTRKFHAKKRGDQCRQGEILKSNLALFPDPEAAQAAGYKPCRACKFDFAPPGSGGTPGN